LVWAAKLGARLVGINNRNILALEKDDGTVSATEQLGSHAPRNAFLISESSIQTPAEAQAAIQAGADAVLIGTAIWQARDMYAFYQALSKGVDNHVS
jgi:indole-3-glycerol phosphate synthase